MTSDKPRRKPAVQLLLSDMLAQTSCQRQRIADEIDQTTIHISYHSDVYLLRRLSILCAKLNTHFETFFTSHVAMMDRTALAVRPLHGRN